MVVSFLPAPADPLIVHVEDAAQALELAEFENDLDRTAFLVLAEEFWPGPLTMVVKAASRIPLKGARRVGAAACACVWHHFTSLLTCCEVNSYRGHWVGGYPLPQPPHSIEDA